MMMVIYVRVLSLSIYLMCQADYGRVLQHTLDIFRAKFEFFRSHIEELDELFEASFSSVAETGRPLSRCGKCQRYLKFIAARPQRMYCPHCNQTYSLPQGGSVKLYKEIKCPLDDFELLVFSSPTKVRVLFPDSHVSILSSSHTWYVHTATTSLRSREWLRGWGATSVLTSPVSTPCLRPG